MIECVRIERLQNGFTVRMTDPKVTAANRKADHKGPWRSPEVEYAFKTADEVMAFLKKNLAAALPLDEFTSSFDAAVGADDD